MKSGVDAHWIALGGTLIGLAAAIVIGFHVLWALVALLRRQGTDRARLIVAEGVLAALSLSVAGTLLATIALQTWTQLGAFVFVYALRTMLKRVFAWERTLIAPRLHSQISELTR